MSNLNVGKLLASVGVKLPSFTNANRPSGESGLIIFNSQEGTVQVHDGTQWINVGTSRLSVTSSGTVLTYTSGSDNWLVFSGPGSFTVSGGGSADILVVGGGGGGSVPYGGGGGAGGVIYYPSAPLTTGLYNVSVGTGGTGRPSNPGDAAPHGAAPGTQSTITGTLSLTALAGGRGGGWQFLAEDGGSGGGGRGNGPSPGGSGTQTTNPTIPALSRQYGYGNRGGNTSVDEYGAGGGGAGGAGQDLSGGIGGNGYQVPTAFLPTNVPLAFQNALGGIPATGPYSEHWRYFGAGGSSDPRGPGTDGIGLGGGGSRQLDPVGGWSFLGAPFGYQPMDAVNGRGSGGGSGNSSPLDWGDGGDGIVIIKYTV